MEKQAEVVIIGGGIIGASVAYHLAEKGMRAVILLEREALGAGSTGRCLGGIRYQFSTEIHVRFSLESFSFFRNCREELGVDPEFKQIGYLFLATSERSQKVLCENSILLGRFGIEIELLTPEEIQRRWPALFVSDVLCGSYCGEEGYAGPHEVLMGYIRGAQMGGCRIYEGVEARGILREGGRVMGVDTNEGKISCTWVVNAAGPYASSVGAMAGVEIPVKPIRRQVFTTSSHPGIPGAIPLVIDLERGWYVRREGEGFLLAGPQDDEPSYNTSLDSGLEAKSWAAENALHRIPALEEIKISGGWAGLYEISPDRHAILGEVPGLGGFLCANGFSGHGFMHSPVAGRL
ncbi:MAG: FAD-binding oxidoreductase, partial [candidate division NC10 bacterium]|nr:FAD-binding oxidoreductase [candidate division NC10 bacterium]